MAMTRKSVSTCTQRFLSVVGAAGTAVSAYWGWDMVLAISKWAIPGATAAFDPVDIYLRGGQIGLSLFSAGVGYKVTSKGIATSIGQHDDLGDEVDLIKRQNEELVRKLINQGNRLRAAETQLDRLTDMNHSLAATVSDMSTILHAHADVLQLTPDERRSLREKNSKVHQDLKQTKDWLKFRHKRNVAHIQPPQIPETPKMKIVIDSANEQKDEPNSPADSYHVKDRRSVSALAAAGKFKKDNRPRTVSAAHPLLKPINGMV